MTLFPLPARIALVTLSIALPAAVSAATAPAPAGHPAQHGQSGMTVVRDPATGQLRAPTAAELRALQQASGQARRTGPDQARPPTVRPDGVKAATLGERGMVYSVITRAPDGSLHQHCVEGEGAAAHTAHTGHTGHQARPQGKKGGNHE
jgi:hypothetical protein